jgi:hypothetical protein
MAGWLPLVCECALPQAFTATAIVLFPRLIWALMELMRRGEETDHADSLRYGLRAGMSNRTKWSSTRNVDRFFAFFCVLLVDSLSSEI